MNGPRTEKSCSIEDVRSLTLLLAGAGTTIRPTVGTEIRTVENQGPIAELNAKSKMPMGAARNLEDRSYVDSVVLSTLQHINMVTL